MNDYKQLGAYSTNMITNQILDNGMTRIWQYGKMWEIKTDPKAARPPMKSQLWRPGEDESDFSKRTRAGNTTGEL